MPVLTDYQVAHYRDHGWVAPVDVLTADEATTLHRALVDAEQAFPDDLHAGHRNNAHLVLPFLADLAIHEVILDCVRSLVDDPRSLLNSVLFIKEPGSRAVRAGAGHSPRAPTARRGPLGTALLDE